MDGIMYTGIVYFLLCLRICIYALSLVVCLFFLFCLLNIGVIQ